MYKIVAFTVTKGRTSWFFLFSLNLNFVHQLKCRCSHVHFYTPSNKVKAQNNEKSTKVSPSTHLAQENENCFIQQHTGGVPSLVVSLPRAKHR